MLLGQDAGDQHREEALGNVGEEDREAPAFAKYPTGIGGAEIARSMLAQIDALGLSSKPGEADRSEQEGGGHQQPRDHGLLLDGPRLAPARVDSWARTLRFMACGGHVEPGACWISAR